MYVHPVTSPLSAWAKQTASPAARAKARLAQLPESEHGTAVPFPVVDGKEAFKARHTNAEINAAIVAAPIVRVPLAGLATYQRSVKAPRVAAYIDGAAPHPTSKAGATPTDVPVVIRDKDTLTIWDGNHRATAAKLLGESMMKARLVDFDKGDA